MITYILFSEGYFNMVLNMICFHEFMLQECYGVSHLTFFFPLPRGLQQNKRSCFVLCQNIAVRNGLGPALVDISEAKL